VTRELGTVGLDPVSSSKRSLLWPEAAAGALARPSHTRQTKPRNGLYMIGQTLGHYRIVQKIASGGMGDVFLAEDTTLDRRVALKTLPPEFARDADRRARLAREAKAIAALHHPNIVTVYSVERVDDLDFITMELVDGRPLAELLPRGGLTLEKFFEIAIPLVDAVAAAHQQGIVHRDLKPGNVMVAGDGRVKVLDFGLAKSTHGQGAPAGATVDATVTQTEAGVVVGTWNYMSPEQARGAPVDGRSDIFALGVIFYELLTGQRPFAGATSADVLTSIIKDVPPAVSSLRADVPRELSRLIRRCLAKDPSRRVQSALDIRNELEELKRDIEAGELLANAEARAHRAFGPSTIVLIVAMLSAAAVVAAVAWRWLDARDVRRLELGNALQVTFAVGAETQPTWSPDGGRIAYVAGGDIWVVQARGGPATNLTRDFPGNNGDPAWSPDGAQIAFASDRDGGGIYLMPAIGGQPVRIASRAGADLIASPAWSADGSELAYLRRDDPDFFIEIVTIGTRESRRLRIPGDPGNRFDLSWSPNGRFFAYVRAAARNDGISRVWVLRTVDAQAVAVTDGTTDDWSPTWSEDPLTLFYVSNRGGSKDLWQQRLRAEGAPDGAPVAVTVGIGMRQATFSADGRKLAYSKGRPVTNAWRVPILDSREAVWEDAQQLTFDEAFIYGLDISHDGKRLIISSDRAGNLDLWSAVIGGSTSAMTQLTTDRSPDWMPRLSPDGQQIAFYSYRSGNMDIWVMPAEGGPAVQITRDPAYEMAPAWSPNGRELAFHSVRSGLAVTNIFVVSAGGGDARRITNSNSPTYQPAWSPDGASIAFVSNNQVWRVATAGGPLEPLVETPLVNQFRFSEDGKRIYFPRSGNLWALTLPDRSERPVTRFSGRTGGFGGFGLAVRGAHLYFTWSSGVGDIWVMDVLSARE
jgi:eukaryotic-like serine/threonine-protein kinase